MAGKGGKRRFKRADCFLEEKILQAWQQTVPLKEDATKYQKYFGPSAIT